MSQYRKCYLMSHIQRVSETHSGRLETFGRVAVLGIEGICHGMKHCAIHWRTVITPMTKSSSGDLREKPHAVQLT